ncbi:MAG: 4-alpha-glucanotransferase [Vicinamibacterales bacterium]
MSDPRPRRRAGLLIPLFSCPSTASWGIGDIGDLAPTAAWLAAAGQRVLQLLPLNEMATGQQSPYSAITAMAIDPIYIAVSAVPEFQACGGEAGLDADDRERLAAARGAPRVDYAEVRRLKTRALDGAFHRFLEHEWRRGSARADALRAFVAAEAWWLDDYALFRAIRARERERAWMEWPAPLRDRDEGALAAARYDLSGEMLRYQYLQWLADTQWRTAREAANGLGVALFGDLPFMVDGDSADVWAQQSQFMLDASVGVPPDAFSATGQDWGMPVYRWDVIAGDGFRWLRARARRSAHLFDGYRVDHLVGFYRTYGRPRRGGDPFFVPGDEPSQTQQGEEVLRIFREPGTDVIAEDLGTVPDFVRVSLARMNVPGFCVARWEREWHAAGHPFRDPASYPERSVAISGTHDTEPLMAWWQQASRDERQMVAALPTVAQHAAGSDLVDAPFNPGVRDALIGALFSAGSELVLMPIQDVFGWNERINEPATVTDRNWTTKLPWPIDRFDEVPEACERRDRLRAWAAESHRI